MSRNTVLPLLFSFPLGLIGLVLGLYGPFLMGPDYPQIPLGIFAAPAGFGFGWLLGQRLARNNASALTVIAAFVGISMIVSTSALLLSFPGSKIDGFVVDAEILSCKPQTVSGQQGIVIRVKVMSRKDIFISRRRWDLGKFTATSAPQSNRTERCFVSGASCGNYSVGTRVCYAWRHSVELPREVPDDALFVSVFEPVPKEYQQFTSCQ